MSKWKNYGLWVSLASVVGLVLSNLGVIDTAEYQKYVDLVLGVLTTLGIISNPSQGAGYKDKESA